MTITTTRLEFLNRLSILRSIDEDELQDVGIKLNDAEWLSFCLDPFRFFLRADDPTAGKLWHIIERRALPAEINWSSAAEATKALDAGLLPVGFSINDAGALVIPDHVATGGLRGRTIVLQRFGEIVTDTGRVVKSRHLSAVRAL